MRKKVKYYEKLLSENSVITALTFITIIGAFLRIYNIGKLSFWLDEVFSYNFAKSDLVDIFFNDPNMSLYYFIIKYYLLTLPNPSDGELRMISAIFSILSIPVIFLLGNSVFKSRIKSIFVGLLSALLLSVNAFHVQYAQEFRSYSLVFLLSSLSTFLFIKFMERPRARKSNYWLAGYTLISVAAFYSHLFALFITLAQISSLCILLRNNIPYKKLIISSVIMASLMFPLFFVSLTRGTVGLTWLQRPTIWIVGKFILELTGNYGWILFTLYFVGASVGTLVALKTWFENDFIARWKYALIINCLFQPVILTLIFSMREPIFADRYLLFVMPYLILLIAIGFVTIAEFKFQKSKYKLILLSVVLAVVTLTLSTKGVFHYYENFRKEDWKGTSLYLQENCNNTNDQILYYRAYMQQNTVYYNSSLKSKLNNWQLILDSYQNQEELAMHIPDKYGKVCLVLGHVLNSTDEKVLADIKSVLSKKYTKSSQMRFYEVDVEMYEKQFNNI